MAIENIHKILTDNPRYSRLKKPLEAAHVCETARVVGKGRFEVISYAKGLLTLGVESSAAAANLQNQSQSIIDELNKKLGEKIIENLKFKIQ